jgi:hypothetical protein
MIWAHPHEEEEAGVERSLLLCDATPEQVVVSQFERSLCTLQEF